MKICPNCGKQLNDNVFFCSACGAKVSDGLNTSPEIDDEKTLSDVYPRTAPATNGITTPPPADIDDEKTLSDVYSGKPVDNGFTPAPPADVNEEKTISDVYDRGNQNFNAQGADIPAVPVTPYEANEPAYVPQQEFNNPPAQYAPAYNQFNPQNGINPAVQAPEPKKKKKGKKGLVIGIIAAVLVLLLAGAAVFYFMFYKQDKAASPTFYVKDGELYVIMSLGKESETILITDDLANEEYAFTDDFKYVVYGENPTKKDDEATTFDLCVKEVMNEKAEETEIDDGVSDISAISGNGEKIYYRKNDNVYCSDKEGKSDKIVSDITHAYFPKDRSCMVAIKGNESKNTDDEYTNTLYYVDLSNNEKTELSSKATYFSFNEDFTKIIFIEAKNLYLSEKGGEPKKIASDAVTANIAGNNIYYTVENKTYKLTDFVKDDYKDKDKGIKEPDWKDYAPKTEDYYPDSKDYEVNYDDYDDYDEYSKAYDAAYEKYSKAYKEGAKKYEEAYKEAEKKYDEASKKYEEAKDRISIRESLDSYGSYTTDYTLYFYNGKNTELLKNVSSMYPSPVRDIGSEKNGNTQYAYSYVYSDKMQTTTFKTALKDVKKYDMAELVKDYDSYSSSSCTEIVTDYLSETIKYSNAVCNGEKVTNLDCPDKYNYCLVTYDSDSSKYILSCSLGNNNTDSEEYVPVKYDVYSLSDTASDFDGAESLAKGVYIYNKLGKEYIPAEEYNSSSKSYDFDYKEDEINDAYSIMCKTDGSDALYFFTDIDNKHFSGTLCKYENGEIFDIADDVYLYSSFDIVNGKYVVIKDYEDNEGGDLMLVDGEEEYKIDKDVLMVIHNHFTYAINACESGYDD